jgi:flagellar biosynthesis GTPase FlhF
VREKAPVASSEQNLAIRQLGAEAAKIAASKKPTLTNISTTNPLLAEKTNAKSPADVLSPKSTPLPKSPNPTTTEKTDGEGKKLLSVELPSLLSPRSIPLPPTPGTVPKPGEQKPVHLPPSMHDDAANPALSAGPIKVTQKHEASPEHKEESSAEDTSAKSVPQKTQDQDPKDASKSGASVKEGEQEEKSNEEEESSEESSAEASAEETKEVETKKVETEGASQKAVPKQSSSEETSEEEEEEEEEESEEEKKEKDTKEVKKTQAQDPKDISKAGESVLD